MGPLLSIIRQFKIPIRKALKLFHSMIRPIALYNSENLANLTHHQIQAMTENKTNLLAYLTESETNIIHQKFLKTILGVKRNCSKMATLGELGEFPLHLYGIICLLSHWHRVTQMHEDTLVNQTLNSVVSDGPSQSEWYATVKFLLTLLDMENLFLNPESITTEKFTTICSEKLKLILIEQWKAKISQDITKNGQNNKLRFYKLFKTSFEMEPYLEHINHFELRKSITKFRCSDHNLEIERGRYKQIKLEERLCKFCPMNVETELHFLQHCHMYSTLRERYFDNVEDGDVVQLLQCKEKYTAFKFANFIKKASVIRKDALELLNPSPLS